MGATDFLVLFNKNFKMRETEVHLYIDGEDPVEREGFF